MFFRLCISAIAIALTCCTASAGEALRDRIVLFCRTAIIGQAHRSSSSLPFGTMVSVTRIDTGAHVVVRINDRGPFIKGRIIDLSRSAAEQLGLLPIGLARVRIQVVPAPKYVAGIAHRDAALRCSACLLAPILE